MNKETEGWKITSSTPCVIVAWGKWMVSLRHISGRVVVGYGVNEQTAFEDAVVTIKTIPESINLRGGIHEISH